MDQTLAEFLDSAGDGAPAEYRAEPWYNRQGDCIHYHWREDEFYGEWIDDKLTVYRSVGSNEAVGIEIKGIAALVQKMGEWRINVHQTDGTPLALFVLASHTTGAGLRENEEDRGKTYRYIIEQVGKQKVEVPVPAEV